MRLTVRKTFNRKKEWLNKNYTETIKLTYCIIISMPRRYKERIIGFQLDKKSLGKKQSLDEK